MKLITALLLTLPLSVLADEHGGVPAQPAKAALEASTRYLAYDLGTKKIRVNCISAGPVQTLAARGISGFSSMIKAYVWMMCFFKKRNTPSVSHNIQKLSKR